VPSGSAYVRRPRALDAVALDPQGRLLVVQDQKAPLPAKVLFRLELGAGK